MVIVSIKINILVSNLTADERKRVIEKWNDDFEKEQDEEKRKREVAEAKINFLLLQQRLQDTINQVKENKDDHS
jgi:hypothetical protein